MVPALGRLSSSRTCLVGGGKVFGAGITVPPSGRVSSRTCLVGGGKVFGAGITVPRVTVVPLIQMTKFPPCVAGRLQLTGDKWSRGV